MQEEERDEARREGEGDWAEGSEATGCLLLTLMLLLQLQLQPTLMTTMTRRRSLQQQVGEAAADGSVHRAAHAPEEASVKWTSRLAGLLPCEFAKHSWN